MIVLTVGSCPPKLRGDLTKWLCEINTGVYVGYVNAKVRDALWYRVCGNIKNGQATMVYSAANEQRMEFRTHNCSWKKQDFDGITLMKRPAIAAGGQPEELKPGFSKASVTQMVKNKNRKQNIRNAEYAFVDLETTGLDQTSDRILEIGVVLASEGKRTAEWSGLISQSKPVPGEITELTGITDKLCADEGVLLKEALKHFAELIGNRIVVLYNAPFDLGFLKSAYEAAGLTYPVSRSIDVLPLARRKLAGIENYKLKTIAERLRVNAAVYHRALNDSITLSDVFFKLNE